MAFQELNILYITVFFRFSVPIPLSSVNLLFKNFKFKVDLFMLF